MTNNQKQKTITIEQGSIEKTEVDAIIVNLFDGVRYPGGATGAIDRALGGAISDVIATGDLRGKLGETVVLYPRGEIPAKRVIVVGLGPADEFSLEGVREAAAAAALQAQKLGVDSLATIVHGTGIGGMEPTDAAQALVEGTLLALYRYQSPLPRTPETPPHDISSFKIVEFSAEKLSAIREGARAGEIIARSVYLTRTLVNLPSNIATPTYIAETAQKMCAENGLSCRVLDEDELRAEGMNVMLSVTQGAAQPAKFIIMEHNPAGAPNTGSPVVLVGKGVAFDTGGYSLKTRTGMPGMHGDMAGGAAVIGTMQAVAQLNVPLHVMGLVPTVENVISATAYKPNDVFVAKNGVSVEIISTDAEGRLILADALCYAATLNPSAVIDVATLTGGKVVALGARTSGLFANDGKLHEKLQDAAEKASEPVWRLPLDPAYDRQLKSPIADLKNTGGRDASAITAARFLHHFIGDHPWAHIDMASGEFYEPGPNHTPRKYVPKGATGVPVRTLVEFLRRWVSTNE